jgi:hypothetical protein
MACPCKTRNRERVQVKLAGGTTITKGNMTEALKFSARHPGSKIVSPAKAA